MSNNPVCQRCENQVQNTWKYCRFCGNKLEISQNSTSEMEKEELDEIEETTPELDSEYSFDKKLYHKVLSTRAERATILKKKKQIRGEIDALLEQLKAGLIDEEAVLPQVKELRKEVQKINEKNRSYSDIPEELPIEVLNDQIDAAKSRLRKIDMLKTDENLGKDTIREAKQRTQQSLELLKDQQSKIFGHLRNWKNELDTNIKETRKEIELLYVRFKTDEITEETYGEKKSEMVKSIENDEEVVTILNRILSN